MVAAEGCRGDRGRRGHFLASMGPRLGGRGRWSSGSTRARLRRGFNGAAAWWPRKGRQPHSRYQPRRCFNGAAAWWPRKACNTSQHLFGRRRFNGAAAWWPRKDRKSHRCSRKCIPLQWGRGLVAAEGPRADARCPIRARASMGPRLGGRGRSAGDRRHAAPVRLQWGRGLVAAEGLLGIVLVVVVVVASMGPRLGGRGRAGDCADEVASHAASMGPRLGGRGRGYEGRQFLCLKDPLQWGRGLVAAEGCAPGR